MSNFSIIIKDANTTICEHDANYLEKLLKKEYSCFSSVELFEVSNVSDLLNVLNKVREIDFSQISTLWVFAFLEISGKRIRLDQYISSSVLFDTFTVLCPTLSNKSKVFVLQSLEKGDDNINPLIMDYWKTENIEIPLPCKPGVLIFMHKVRGRPCNDNKACLFKSFKNFMDYKTDDTGLINLFMLLMSTIDRSIYAPTPPFLFSTITNMTTLEEPASQDLHFQCKTS